MFEEVIDNLLLSLDLSVHLIKLLLEPVHSHVGSVKVPYYVDGFCSFWVLDVGLAALAGLVVLLAGALVDLVDANFKLGLQQQLLLLTELRLHHEQAFRLAQPELELFLLPLPPCLELILLGPGDTGHVQRGDLHRDFISRQVFV